MIQSTSSQITVDLLWCGRIIPPHEHDVRTQSKFHGIYLVSHLLALTPSPVCIPQPLPSAKKSIFFGQRRSQHMQRRYNPLIPPLAHHPNNTTPRSHQSSNRWLIISPLSPRLTLAATKKIRKNAFPLASYHNPSPKSKKRA
jgi:hypothetical protein